MATDPAFLFYSADFLTGVSDLTMEERGQFITLLCLQHQKGPLSTKSISLSVGAVSDDVLKKFSRDENGFFINTRLLKETERRNNFTQSRRNNALSKKKNKKAYPKHTHKRMETDTDNENVNRNINEDENKKHAKILKIEMPFSENFAIIWQHWKAYKAKEHKFFYKSSQSEQAALNELMKLANGLERPAFEIIHQSMAKGWKGFFKINNFSNGKQATGREVDTSDLLSKIARMYSPAPNAGKAGG